MSAQDRIARLTKQLSTSEQEELCKYIQSQYCVDNTDDMCHKCKVRNVAEEGMCHMCKLCEENEIEDVDEFNRFYNNCSIGNASEKIMYYKARVEQDGGI